MSAAVRVSMSLLDVMMLVAIAVVVGIAIGALVSRRL